MTPTKSGSGTSPPRSEGSTALGELLRRERRRRGETQAQAAARFGIAQPSYHRWESGENRPDDEKFTQIGGYLGISAEEVLRVVHQTELPTSLEQVRDDVRALQRDVDDLKEALGQALSTLSRIEENT
ncbi:MAG: helix-turn-helix transcriptional regulator [Actinomycetota bacterium]